MPPAHRSRITGLVVAGLLAASCVAADPPPAGPNGPASTPGPVSTTPTIAPETSPTAWPSRSAEPSSGAALTAAPSTAPSGADRTADPDLAPLIGQRLIVRMDGTAPSADLLGRIRRGEVGGVTLFGSNITTARALQATTRALRAAADAGGQPRLLIAVDQEGGRVRRIAWAPPSRSVPEMGRIGSVSLARDQGAATGEALHRLGIDVDLAPVADVPDDLASAMASEGRTFSTDADRTARLADAFATGLESAGVIPAMKHFPGLGLAADDTDGRVVTIAATRAQLAAGLRPYRTAISHDLPLIMLSNAIYPAYDPSAGAGWSKPIVETLLRHDLGFAGATITDSLSGAAAIRGVPVATMALRAAAAGTDLLLLTGSEASTRAAYRTLLAQAAAEALDRFALLASYRRILALKARD